MRKSYRIDLLMVSIALIWGMNFSIMKGLYTWFHPLAFTALRFVVSVATLWIILRLLGHPLRIDRADFPAILGLGFLSNTLYQLLFVLGLAGTRAGNAGLLMAVTPVFAYFTGILMKRERFSAKVLLGILISMGGVGGVIAFGHGEIRFGSSWRGDLMVLGAALCWGWYSGSAGRLIAKYGSLRLTLWLMATGTVLMLPILAPFVLRQDWSAIPPVGWLSFCYSTFLSIVYCYIGWAYALRHIGVGPTAAYSNLTPIVALAGGWILLAETPAVAQGIGVVLILSGVFLVRTRTRFPFRRQASRTLPEQPGGSR